MSEFSLPEFLVICGSVLLIALLLTEMVDWSQLFLSANNHRPSGDHILPFGYASHNGPHTWKKTYPHSGGSNQSPINITSRSAIVVQLSEPLKWSGYRTQPVFMTMANDGNSVSVCGFWPRGIQPCIQGGSLCSAYDCHSMVFHWGPSDNEGSEHTIDYVRYPMEMQMVHLRRGVNENRTNIMDTRESILIISYFFEITNVDNPYLDHVITNLWRVTNPGTRVYIPPFPLEWIFPPFEKNYYSYSGSLTQPPCSEVVIWIIQPETIAVSSSQVAQFRKICSTDGPMRLNSRPVQKLNDRDVYFHD
ncbi:carbonic anhydrase 1 [Cephus cinctus]|uniref:Carbonic anhydrase 1 n=1 Tax=Cephus cinctus TaxID=211228 RepID=A0AAJ7RTG7_CEPCN|nr:carbonic anhydrase 1 [Cephus cinctus]XP_024946141.1 carbonic anhydrase 1 [Cephus cinctus]